MAGTIVPSADPAWWEEEKGLRRDEVRAARKSVRVQAAIGLAAVVATAIAAYTALKAAEAVDVAANGIEREAHEQRLSTAVASLGSDQPAQRIAGLTLLRYHVDTRLSAADGDDEEREAHGLYATGLDIVENYLRTPPAAGPATGTDGQPAGRGYGRPRVPADTVYAANQLHNLLKMQERVERLDGEGVPNVMPAVDLANAQLYGQSWPSIDFSWLGGHHLPGVDLRGANLGGSRWGRSTDDEAVLEGASLDGAFLQCADLSGAKLIETSLVGADLRGADVTGADFTGADVTDAKLDGATGIEATTGLGPSQFTDVPAGVARARDGTSACLRHEAYWAER